MPTATKTPKPRGESASSGSSARCKALTTGGEPCRRRPLPGLKVCKSHGGGTATSTRKSKKASALQKASLWGITSGAGSIDVVSELNKLANNKLTDITALRIELGSSPDDYYGMLDVAEEVSSSDTGGYSEKKVRKSGVHPLVDELHKAENELVQILKLIREVSGESSSEDLTRIRMQTARETARLLKAYPGMGVDEAATEVAKRV